MEPMTICQNPLLSSVGYLHVYGFLILVLFFIFFSFLFSFMLRLVAEGTMWQQSILLIPYRTHDAVVVLEILHVPIEFLEAALCW